MLSNNKTTADFSFFYQDLTFYLQKNLARITMKNFTDITIGKSAIELMLLADSLRKENRFGEAINIYAAAAEAPDATDEISTKARIAIELIQEINGFVNVDLMNP